ncbi:hypothetical protein A2774_03125 [Candidatus Roizmanbacteria bacterium RIFCSPHIGHO2_01_FULL_39_12c]|uniref:Uncharacterized protein n=1 Tax=Candidatus Roizmanbacteria bacterium RIFCSPHIGHO2_01_FULL_39_12c TaxID=1802031 RepID=A0A1F7GCJ4_9BACT|nr:MAG: hypothetical protein A2774_03125 [Candidatus Roizmanbacteria bacterium RIFCSPHIGHO2_01_FULL_39_12c]
MSHEHFRQHLRNALEASKPSVEPIAKPLSVNLPSWENIEAILAEVQERNNIVTRLDAQLPIKDYLEILRTEVAPKHKLLRFGATGGKVAYAFTYHEEKQKIHVADKRRMKKTRTIYARGGSAEIPSDYPIPYKEPIFKGLIVSDVLGVVLDSNGDVQIDSEKCVKLNNFALKNYLDSVTNTTKLDNVGFTQSFNPIDWKFYYLPKISVTNPEGLAKFTQALTDVYVNLKTK